MNEKQFQTIAAESDAKANHENEIQKTRVGGFGGSDAALFLKISQKGLPALSNSDLKRIAIAMGEAAGETWGGNAYTNAGHLFEDFAERELQTIRVATIDSEGLARGLEREKLLTPQSFPLAKNFKVFAHADFVIGGDSVVECKFVQETTQSVARKYLPQLQWYYMLGARRVALFHGWGDVEPFAVANYASIAISRDDDLIEALLDGIKTLDDAIGSGWHPDVKEKQHVDDSPTKVWDAFAALMNLHERKAEVTQAEAEAKGVLLDYMTNFGLSEIFGFEDDGGVSHKVTICKPRTTRTFDLKAFEKGLEKTFDNAPDLLAQIRQIIADSYRTTKSSNYSVTYK